MADITNRTFQSLHFTQDYQSGGAVLQTQLSLTVSNSTFDDNGGRNYSSYGGAIAYSGDYNKVLTVENSVFSNNIAHHGGALSAPASLNLTNVTFNGNQARPNSFAGYGGAIFLQHCEELNYTVTSGNNISNQGNYASVGGFLHDHEGGGVFTFNIENNASLTIGSVNTSTDSINLHKGSRLVKTGEGTMVINSVLERRHPYTSEGTCTDGDITVSGGVLELNRGGTFDGTVKITGGQLKLGAAYTFNSVEFELGTPSSVAMVSDWSKLNTSVITIDAANAADGTYVLMGNASGFNRNITLTVNSERSVITAGDSVSIDRTVYSLALSGSNLVLTVGRGTESSALVVTTAEDVVNASDGVTSLREAIAYANTLSGTNTITFNIASGDTVTLNNTLTVSSSVIIDGTNAAGNGNITVKAATTQAESQQNGSVASTYTLFNASGDSFTLRDITVKGGNANALDIGSDVSNFSMYNVSIADSFRPVHSLAQNVVIDNLYMVNNSYGFDILGNVLITNSTFDGSNIRESNEVNGGFFGLADGSTCTVVNSTFLNNEVAHSGAAIYIGSGSVFNLVNCTVANAIGHLGYGNSMCSVLGGSFNILNSIVVTPDGASTPDIGAAFGSSNTIRNSVYGSISSNNNAVNSYSGYDSEDLFVSPNGADENHTMAVRDDAAVLNNAVLAAVDPETLTVYYSADNGSSWRRLDNDAVAAINNSWIIDEDQNGNSRLTGTNKIGAVIATGSAGSGTTPPSGGDTPSGDNNHSFANAIDLGTDSAIRAFANGSIPQAYEEDYYRFTLTSRASITWTTSGASGDTMLYLYDSNQNQIAYNDDGGDGLFSQLALELDAGTYYIKVKAWSSGTVADYTLTPTIAGSTADALTVTTAADVVDANDGVTSLREALTAALSLGGNQRIDFNMSNGDSVVINDPALVSRNIQFAATNTANGNPVTVVLNNLSISGRSTSTSSNVADGGAVMKINNANVSVVGGTYENNRDGGSGGHAGVFRLENNATLTVDGATFKNNYAYSAGGAICNRLGHSTITIRNSHFEGNNAVGYGGALSLEEATLEIVDTDFVNNTTGHSSTTWFWSGGAIAVRDTQMTYTVSAGQTITNTGNDSSFGGFLVMNDSTAEFRVEGTLNIGNGDGKDSIETHRDNVESSIRKTGSGTMTINAPTSNYNGEWSIEGGVLAFTYANGGSFSDTITISGGQLQLGANYTFTDICFQLGNTVNTTSFINDASKLSGGTFTVDATNAAVGIYKLAGNAANFNTAISLVTSNSSYENALTVGSQFSVGGKSYQLSKDNANNLTLTISGNSASAANGLVVTTTADVVDANDGVTSLREAIANAASDSSLKDSAGKFTITFADSIFSNGVASITLSSSLTIDENAFTDSYGELVIQGDTAGRQVILDGNNSVGILIIDDYNNISVDNLTFQNGVSRPGGAIYNHEYSSVTISDCVFTGNRATADGGVISNDGTMTVSNSLLAGNSAANGGGAICNWGSNALLTVTGCTITDSSASYGGAVFNCFGAVSTLANCTITGNSARTGSAVYNMSGTVNLVNNIISGNSNSGAISFNVNNLYDADATAQNLFVELDSNGEPVLNADGTFHILENGAAAGSGVYVWHSADYSAIAYSSTIDGAKIAVRGDAALATILSTDQLGNNRVAGGTDIGAVLANINTNTGGTPPPVATGDSDDQISEAVAIASVANGAIDNNTDVDMYKFSVGADERIILQTSTPGDATTFDSYLRLFDANGTEIAANDDGGQNLGALINHTFREGGTYYVGVSHYANSHYNAISGENDQAGKSGSYQLTLVRNGFDDSNDQISEAAVITSAAAVNGEIAYASDVNMYKFEVGENAVRKFTVSSGSTARPYLRVFNASGEELAAGFGEVQYAFRNSGSYYVAVSGEENRAYSPVNGGGDSDNSAACQYSLTMQEILQSYQDNDDTAATATLVTLNGAVTLAGNIEAATDVDMYKFTVAANEELSFTISELEVGDAFNGYLRLFDASGNQLSFSANGSMSYRFTSGGTVYLGVSDDGNIGYDPVSGSGDLNADTGEYSLTVHSRVNQAVLLNSATDLGSVTVSGPVVESASIDRPNEVDMYSFTVNAGDRIRIDLDNLAGSSLDSYFRLFNSSGTMLASNDDAPAPGESSTTCESYIEYTFTTAGRYYLGVSAYGNSQYSVVTNQLLQSGDTSGSYRLAFGLYVNDTDSDDRISSAVAISSGERKSSSIESGTDVDMYKVVLQAGETLTASVSLQGLQDSYLRLFDQSGNEIACNDDFGTGKKNSKASQITWQAQSAGTYYIGVSGYGNMIYNAVTGGNDTVSRYTGNYTLSVEVDDSMSLIANDRYENNDTMSTAANLGSLSGNVNITGLTMNDSADWFKFTLTSGTRAGSEVSLNAVNVSGMSLSVYDSSGELVAFSANGKKGVSLANFSAGDYYIKVSGAESENYHVAFKLKEAPVVTGNRSENYVVLFSGGYNSEHNNLCYYNNIKDMYETVTGTLGIDPSHVYILFADGTDPGIDNAAGGNSDFSFAADSTVLAATEHNLRNVFDSISATADNNDHFLFYSFDHGTTSSSGTDYLCGWNEMIEDADFASYAAELTAGYQTYLFSQCFAGGFLEEMSVNSTTFIGAASSSSRPSQVMVDNVSGEVVDGFAYAVSAGLAQGITNTRNLLTYTVNNNSFAADDGQCQSGGNFSIFAGSTNSPDADTLNNTNNRTGSVLSNSFVSNKNGEYLPTVTSLSIYDESLYDTVNSAQIGETVAISAKAASLNSNTTVEKVEFFYTDISGSRRSLYVDSDNSDGWQFLWELDNNYTAGYGVISAVAMDSAGTSGVMTEVDFRIIERNYHPDVTSIAVNGSTFYPGAQITVSGTVYDVDSNGIDSVRIYMDLDKNGSFSYPDEYLGLVNVNIDGSWSYSSTLSSSLAAGNYTVMAEAVDALDMLSGEAMTAAFNVVEQQLSNFEIISNAIQWKNPSSSDCIIEVSSDTFGSALSVATSGSSVDIVNPAGGSYATRARYSDGVEWSAPQTIAIASGSTGGMNLVSNGNGALDIFFARTNGTWDGRYAAKHGGFLNGWSGTRERVSVTGKNVIEDVFSGSDDASVLVLTDSANGDALFLDDVFSDLGTQARLSQIDEIRAGAGDDVVDMTSHKFAFAGDGLTVYGGSGNDTIWANSGSNTLYGDAGNDRIVGGSGNDWIIGGAGNDLLHGGGGDDAFCFGNNWGADTVEQLAGGKVSLYFESGSINNWNAATQTYSDGSNSVTVTGTSDIELYFGTNANLPEGAFADAASEKIFEEINRGMLA